METNDFLRDKFNEIEILKGKLITYPKECSKDIISKIDTLCEEIFGHIEKGDKKKHKDEDMGKEKNKCKEKEKTKEKSKYKEKNKDNSKCNNHKCDWDKCEKDKGKEHTSKKSESELVDKFMKIYNGECEVCKSKEKRVRNLMRMIEDELEDEVENENFKKNRVGSSREYLKDLDDGFDNEEIKKKE